MNDWREITLSDVSIAIDYGYTASANALPIGPKFLRITDIVPKMINWDEVPYCHISEKEKNKYKLEAGDIVIARTGASTGANYLIKKSDPNNLVFASYLIRFKINDKIAFPDFIGQLLSSNLWKNYVDGIIGGSAQPGANAKVLGSFPIFLPPLLEQRAIASVLSSLDDKINLLHRQNATLEAMAEALFKQWFVVEAKEEWEEYTVENISKQLSDTINPLLFSDLLFNLYSIPAYDLNKNPEQSYGENILSNKFKIDANCLLVSKLNPKFPRIWLLLENNLQNSIASTEFIPIVPFDKQNLPFLYCLFSSDRVIQELTNAASGTSGSHQRVRPDDILNITFMTPSLKYISEFSNSILPFFKKISFNHRRIFTLEKLRDSLLPKLMSGEVRVKF